MPKGGDVRARLRKKLHDRSVALHEEARRVAEQRDALQASHTKETIDKIIELKILKAKGDALLSDVDGLAAQVQKDADNAKTEDERTGAFSSSWCYVAVQKMRSSTKRSKKKRLSSLKKRRSRNRSPSRSA